MSQCEMRRFGNDCYVGSDGVYKGMILPLFRVSGVYH
jgi:hypothetical protein